MREHWLRGQGRDPTFVAVVVSGADRVLIYEKLVESQVSMDDLRAEERFFNCAPCWGMLGVRKLFTNCQHTEVQGSFVRIALNDSLLEKRACNGAQVKVLIAIQARRLRMDLEREREEATYILMATQSL